MNVPWVGGGQIFIVGPGANTVQPTVGFVGCTGTGVSIITTLPNNLTLTNLVLSSGANPNSIDHLGVGQVCISNIVFGSVGPGHIHASAPARR